MFSLCASIHVRISSQKSTRSLGRGEERGGEGRRGEERGGEGRRGEERGGGREKGRGIALIQTTGNIFLAAEYGEGAECVYFLCF